MLEKRPWQYGLAQPIIPPGITGDFNNDGVVNGLDFLAWQRGNSPNPLSADDLADWQNNYGTGALAASAAIPEPTTTGMLAMLMMAAVYGRPCGNDA